MELEGNGINMTRSPSRDKKSQRLTMTMSHRLSSRLTIMKLGPGSFLVLEEMGIETVQFSKLEMIIMPGSGSSGSGFHDSPNPNRRER